MILFNKAMAVDGVLCPPLGHVLFHSLNNFFFNSGDEPDLLSAAGNCKTNTIWGVQLSSKKTSDSEVSEKPDVVAFDRGE